MVTRIALIATVTLALGFAPRLTADEAGEELARQVQSHYGAVRDFTAEFEQSYEGGVLRQRTVERGTVEIKKPGRMRWDYTRPEEKLFVSDGSQMYVYVPADRQVIVRAMPSDDRASTPILFLSGKGNLVRDFKATELTEGRFPAGTRALKLLPRRAEPEYESLTLIVDGKTFALRQLVARDGQGGTSTFVFTNVRENVGLTDGRFVFKIPRGVDVVRQG
jgi:outer membrane lipoprotein carrier protein